MSYARSYLSRLEKLIGELNATSIDDAIELIRRTWLHDRTVITLGNGGSALTALHYITDWSKSITLAHNQPFRGRSLVDNMGLITAYGNDISFADIFAEQLKSGMSPGDLIIAISGSGNSENVIRAVDYANERGNPTLGICGFDGGRLKKVARYNVWVNCNDMQLCEDVHLIFGHMVMKSLCAATS